MSIFKDSKSNKKKIDYEVCWETFKAYLQILELQNPNMPVKFSETMEKIEIENTVK